MSAKISLAPQFLLKFIWNTPIHNMAKSEPSPTFKKGPMNLFFHRPFCFWIHTSERVCLDMTQDTGFNTHNSLTHFSMNRVDFLGVTLCFACPVELKSHLRHSCLKRTLPKSPSPTALASSPGPSPFLPLSLCPLYPQKSHSRTTNLSLFFIYQSQFL